MIRILILEVEVNQDHESDILRLCDGLKQVLEATGHKVSFTGNYPDKEVAKTSSRWRE